jgi:hypothetical protein
MGRPLKQHLGARRYGATDRTCFDFLSQLLVVATSMDWLFLERKAVVAVYERL